MALPCSRTCACQRASRQSESPTPQPSKIKKIAATLKAAAIKNDFLFYPVLLHFDFLLGNDGAGLGVCITRFAVFALTGFCGFTAGSILGFAARFHVGT